MWFQYVILWGSHFHAIWGSHFNANCYIGFLVSIANFSGLSFSQIYHFCTCINTCRIYYWCSNNNGNRSLTALLVIILSLAETMIGDICIIEYHHKRDEIARKNDTSQKIILVLSKLVLAILSFNISYCFFRVVQKQLKLHVNCYFDKNLYCFF